MDLLGEKFKWILPLYMKLISFQSTAWVVCSVTAAIFVDFCPKKSVFPTYQSKNKWICEFRRTNPQKLECWSPFCVNYFLRYYLMMQHQPIVTIVNVTHEWAQRPYQLLSALNHCCLYKHRQQVEMQPLQAVLLTKGVSWSDPGRISWSQNFSWTNLHFIKGDQRWSQQDQLS